MSTHTNKPPPFQQAEVPSGKDAFKFLGGVFIIAVNTLALFWTFVVKKPGTIGTRVFWFDFFCAYMMFIALGQCPWPLEQAIFQLMWVAIPLMYVGHLVATMSNPVHVHTQCVGKSRFPGKGDIPKQWELVAGCTVGFALILVGAIPGVPSLFHVGGFVIVSAFANGLRDGLIEERDRQRSVKMRDALWEMQYTMDNFARHNKGRF